MSEQDQNAETRRAFFRIDDQVLLGVRPVDAAEAAELAGQINERMTDRKVPDRFAVTTSFAVNSRAMARLLHGISTDSPDVARYLKMMDQKLNQLARLFVLDEVETGDYPQLEVNISAGGLVFPSRVAFAPESLLEARIVLLPNLTGILTVARVVYCDAAGEAGDLPWRVTIEYLHIRESDRDLLVSHIMLRETEMLRRQRGEGEE
ncbi:MAG: PilZ domain-containing protein [Thiohalobacteraceae bacterium]